MREDKEGLGRVKVQIGVFKGKYNLVQELLACVFYRCVTVMYV